LEQGVQIALHLVQDKHLGDLIALSIYSC